MGLILAVPALVPILAVAEQLDMFGNSTVSSSIQNLIKDCYRPVYYGLGQNDMVISTVGSYLLMIFWFWAVGGLLLYIDLSGKPKWITKYKVQQDQNVPVDKEKLSMCLKTVAFNNLFLNLLMVYPMYHSQQIFGFSFKIDDIPSFYRIILEFVVFALVWEVVFYYGHRLFHVPWIYKIVHKKHHQWTAPIGIVAIYATPIEYVTGNVFSVFLGPLLMRSHIVTWWLWYSFSTIVTLIHHSGYHMPFLASPQFHDYHHLTFNWNFGILGLLDKFHGTDKQFNGSIQWARHKALWHLTPMSELYPAEKAKDKET